MIQIPVMVVSGDYGPENKPSLPIPDDNIGVFCDGVNYTVYEPGDTVPAQAQG